MPSYPFLPPVGPILAVNSLLSSPLNVGTSQGVIAPCWSLSISKQLDSSGLPKCISVWPV